MNAHIIHAKTSPWVMEKSALKFGGCLERHVRAERALTLLESRVLNPISLDNPDLRPNQPSNHLKSHVYDLPKVCVHFSLSDRLPESVLEVFQVIFGLKNHL